MFELLKKPLSFTVLSIFMLQMTACGTLLYPERKGQVSGKLNPTVVALDTVGLLFFLVPGIIAFAVDYNNGTIYLPSGDAKKIHGELTPGNIESFVQNNTGHHIELQQALIKKYPKQMNTNEILAKLSEQR